MVKISRLMIFAFALLLSGCATIIDNPAQVISGLWMDPDSIDLKISEFRTDGSFSGRKWGHKWFSKTSLLPWRIETDAHSGKPVLLIAKTKYLFEFEGHDSLIIKNYPQGKLIWKYLRSPYTTARLRTIENQMAKFAKTGNLDQIKRLVSSSTLDAYRQFLKRKAVWAVYYAAVNKHWDVTSYLLDNATPADTFEQEVIFLLLQERNHRVITQLLDKGMGLERLFDMADRQGLTLINLAAREADFELMKMLIDRGSNLEHKINDGLTISQDIASCQMQCPRAMKNVTQIKTFLKQYRSAGQGKILAKPSVNSGISG